MAEPLLGGIEAGGTKFRCCIGRPGEPFLVETTIPTTTPGETLAAVRVFFEENVHVASIGIAAFGPVDVDPESESYGTILDTPKTGWQGVDLTAGLTVPFSVHTDVTGAALAECQFGASQGCGVSVYVTIGTGIGAAVLVDGRPLPSVRHGEFGHIRVPKHPGDAAFDGVCPFHGDCLEGLASGPAMIERWGEDPATLNLPAAWDLEAYYLASACVVLDRTLAPDRIVLGGGIMQRDGLLTAVIEQVEQLHGTYYASSSSELEKKIVLPGLGADAGLAGALLLARASETLKSR